MERVHDIAVFQLIVRRIIDILAPGACSDNHNIFRRVFANHGQDFFGVRFNVAIPVDIAVRLVGNFKNDVWRLAIKS